MLTMVAFIPPRKFTLDSIDCLTMHLLYIKHKHICYANLWYAITKWDSNYLYHEAAIFKINILQGHLRTKPIHMEKCRQTLLTFFCHTL